MAVEGVKEVLDLGRNTVYNLIQCRKNPEYMNRPPDLGDESSAAPVSK